MAPSCSGPCGNQPASRFRFVGRHVSRHAERVNEFNTRRMIMPHVIVEYSANLESKVRIDALLQVLHETVEHSGVAELAGIRTRAARREHFRVADNDPANAFVAIYIRVAQGRTLDTRKKLANLVFKA